MASSGVMKDSYVGGMISSSCIQHNNDMPFCVTVTDEQPQTPPTAADDEVESILFGGKTKGWGLQSANQTDEDKIIHLTCTDEANTNINKTEEYNIGYSGLSILPWEEFIFNPRVFNDLFYTESNQRITFDPEEVNVFFHGKNVMPPTIGDISENGKSWNIDVDNIGDLRKVRKLLTERCSVFGVTLQYKEKRFAKPVRAPCLVLMDPSQGGIGDRLYTTLTKAMDTIHNQRRFCVEINLNVCVERWCKRVLLTDCKAVGAKLYVTNGEEYTPLNESTEDIVCCVVCFPVWMLGTCIYKLHRMVTYDDYMSDFDAEDMFLHGSYQDAQYQRQQIFKEASSEDVFRTRSANQTDSKTLQALGTYKFVCVKKVKKSEDESTFKEHSTATFGSLVDKRKEKVLYKDKKILDKKISKNAKSHKEQSVTLDLGNCESSQDVFETKENQHDEEDKGIISQTYTNEAFSSSDDEREENQTEKTPRIPEIASVLCQHDQDEDVEIEVPVDFEIRGDNKFIKTSDSLDQDALDFKIRKDCSDSKSMTAVCSFQISDTASEYESSDEEDEDHIQTEVKSSKENLIEEMKKIDRTLPKIQTRATNSDIKTSNENSEKDKNGKQTKSKKKIMLGQAFREITKTTNKPVTKNTSFDEEKNIKVCEKDNIETNVTNEKNEAQKNNNPDQHKNEAKAVQPCTGNEGDDVGTEINESQTDEKSSRDEISESNKVINSTKENTVSDFNLDNLSSDGDDVEMIYQSHRSKYSESQVKETPGTNSTLLTHHKGTGLDIERVAETNKHIVNKISEDKTHDTDEISDNDELKNATAYSDTSKNTNTNTLFGVTKVEGTLDITDIDDIDEDDCKGKPNIKVPPLKLNIGETLGKKVKRGSRQYNSNRKYLGAAVPSKTKRMHKE